MIAFVISFALSPSKALLDGQLLSRMTKRRYLRILLVDIAQVDSPLGELADNDLAQALETRAIVNREKD